MKALPLQNSLLSTKQDTHSLKKLILRRIHALQEAIQSEIVRDNMVTTVEQVFRMISPCKKYKERSNGKRFIRAFEKM